MLYADEKILTWHPEGRRGVYMARKDYDVIFDFICSALKAQELTITELIAMADVQLAGSIDNDISWYILTVKLDLEARGLITTVLKPSPYRSQFLKLRPRAWKKYNSSVRKSSVRA